MSVRSHELQLPELSVQFQCFHFSPLKTRSPFFYSRYNTMQSVSNDLWTYNLSTPAISGIAVINAESTAEALHRRITNEVILTLIHVPLIDLSLIAIFYCHPLCLPYNSESHSAHLFDRIPVCSFSIGDIG